MVLTLDVIWNRSRKMVTSHIHRKKSSKTKENQSLNNKIMDVGPPNKTKSRIPVAVHRYTSNSNVSKMPSSPTSPKSTTSPLSSSTYSSIIQVTDLDKSENESEPTYNEISYSSVNKFKKNHRFRTEMPEYLRKSQARHQKCFHSNDFQPASTLVNNKVVRRPKLNNHFRKKEESKENIYSNIDSTCGSINDPGLVKCHLYETLTPKRVNNHRGKIIKDDCSTSEDEKPQTIEERAVIHPSPVIVRCKNSRRSRLNKSTEGLLKDDDGIFLSPILPACDISPPPPQPQKENRGCRMNLEDRFVVNTYRASYWQRLSGRDKLRIDAPHMIKVTERPDSGIHSSDSHSDNEPHMQTKTPKQIDECAKDNSRSTLTLTEIARFTPKSTSNLASTSTSATSLLSDVGFVGELYRARITPDKILAKNLKLRQRQRRVVPASLLSMFDDMMSERDIPPTPDSPPKAPEEEEEHILTLLDHEASKLENLEEIDDLNGIQWLTKEQEEVSQKCTTEVIYATPLKAPKMNNKINEYLDFADKLNSPLKDDSIELECKVRNNSSLDNETFVRLKEEADYQCKIMRQASKALEVSRRSDHTSIDQRPRVEAEKILLTANCKYEKVLQEIRQTTYEKPIDAKQTGSIQISNISIPLNSITDEQTGWFVLVMMDDKRIFSTTPIEIHPHHRKIDFHRTFLFDQLDGNFELSGKIYCLLHKKCEKAQKAFKKYESRLSNKLRLSGRKLRYVDLYTKDPVENNIITSSFVPMGYFKVSVNDLQEKGERNIRMTLYENSPLGYEANMDIKLAQMNIAVEKLGMLNVRSQTNQIVWNRRWCTLCGTVMKFWNSPLDESFKDPVMVIDLLYCQQEIESAKREECPRPKTLSIVGSKGRFYLNFDTLVELREWKKVMNEVYRGLRDWKLLKK